MPRGTSVRVLQPERLRGEVQHHRRQVSMVATGRVGASTPSVRSHITCPPRTNTRAAGGSRGIPLSASRGVQGRSRFGRDAEPLSCAKAFHRDGIGRPLSQGASCRQRRDSATRYRGADLVRRRWCWGRRYIRRGVWVPNAFTLHDVPGRPPATNLQQTCPGPLKVWGPADIRDSTPPRAP